MRFTGTSGSSASDWGSGYSGQSRYYIQLTITFGYTFPSDPICFWHWGSFNNHQSTIASTNTNQTSASAYTHAYTAGAVQSLGFNVLVVGERN